MIDTFNKQGVSTQFGGQDQADQIAVLFPIQTMSKEEALMLAAWIVVQAEGDIPFEEYLKAVRNS